MDKRQRDEFKKRIKSSIIGLMTFIDALPASQTTKIISGQLLRSGTSMGANYFEAIAASSKKDFINF
ncbi:four helix bundle protein [candidate division TA06 bacterium]|uniref:Four helix bundle protein n=1 Tax=candidate division TA06 bacterium TaxID=2250710 RepID=A0A933IAL7_UNCT6|nr:four helix bundle protein [candidate division TA06 bacterium]